MFFVRSVSLGKKVLEVSLLFSLNRKNLSPGPAFFSQWLTEIVGSHSATGGRLWWTDVASVCELRPDLCDVCKRMFALMQRSTSAKWLNEALQPKFEQALDKHSCSFRWKQWTYESNQLPSGWWNLSYWQILGIQVKRLTSPSHVQNEHWQSSISRQLIEDRGSLS